MIKLTLNEAQSQLSDLLKAASKGEQVIIQNNEGQDFQLISLPTTVKHPQYGSAKGIVKMLDNFDDPIEEFEEYMP
ncbi:MULTISPECIES: type II toxin-antitoxin system prevent-host-death family antitoxin [Microcystis]|jgi:prevent-host-death family protein|uniref:Type II toxin-antitoxin system prevent-host-death family antitoxin n=1 Tax=Microcystis flos-aquae Mf_QC_C_20070823_S10D TaxID=2486236 RepID=A0A552KUF3_9CHRO|nr:MULTISPECIES: type II toxin-antitoxin system prevent-host-death family antitoxin [Microcystis]MCA2815469.1 type II toxin-antitoxin system prevent-host-death family antitoxin [Microcystis sp. M085S1]MCA2853523.1 type II toxin-antitoxin system prevent-host-death family antitoxin [Microcystis sp. M065S1]TRT77555.1 MAG: type II toxin-antitoxin system prevent-host-death family antitoxin [Microcystis flos-aquae Ma_QC_C_20070823_S18]TRU02964.1 MAG: type II toxin-antitoxin system prevent-host-death 